MARRKAWRHQWRRRVVPPAVRFGWRQRSRPARQLSDCSQSVTGRQRRRWHRRRLSGRHAAPAGGRADAWNVAVHLRRHSQGGDASRRRPPTRDRPAALPSPTTARRRRRPMSVRTSSSRHSPARPIRRDPVTALMVISKATPVVTWNNAGGHLQPGAALGSRAERDGECAGHVRVYAGPRCDSARWSPADTLGRLHTDRSDSTTTSPPHRSRST